MEKANYETISIVEKQHCKDCGWPTIFVCCNGSFTEYKDASTYDWWVYCSNKVCKNHEGEGTFQSYPDWLIKD